MNTCPKCGGILISDFSDACCLFCGWRSSAITAYEVITDSNRFSVKQRFNTNCRRCGNKTVWDYGIGNYPLCRRCWDSSNSDNPPPLKKFKKRVAAKDRRYYRQRKKAINARRRVTSSLKREVTIQ